MQLNDKTFKIGTLRRRGRVNFFQTSSAFGDPLDLSDHPLLLDIFSLGPPQLHTGLGFLFYIKVSFEKHPSGHSHANIESSLLIECVQVFKPAETGVNTEVEVPTLHLCQATEWFFCHLLYNH